MCPKSGQGKAQVIEGGIPGQLSALLDTRQQQAMLFDCAGWRKKCR
jgi:hypothetical protein